MLHTANALLLHIYEQNDMFVITTAMKVAVPQHSMAQQQ